MLKNEQSKQNIYILNYSNSVGYNINIPGKFIAIYENNKFYFIEYNKDEFQTTLSSLFESEVMDCIFENAEEK